jgi:hypothetical protein
LVRTFLKDDLKFSTVFSIDSSLSFFYDDENSYYVQRNLLLLNNKLQKELRLFSLLNSYGAKFSSPIILFYDLDSMKEFIKRHPVYVNMPSIYSQNDHVSFKNVKIQPEHLTPIAIYLQCLNYVVKLNIPTMFLMTNKANKTRNIFDAYGGCKSASLGSDTQNDLLGLNRNLSEELELSNESLSYYVKLLIKNLDELIDFVLKNVIDSFEKNFYVKTIQEIQNLLKCY